MDRLPHKSPHKLSHKAAHKSPTLRVAQSLEPRRMMAGDVSTIAAADPIHVGVVYLETDYLESDADTGGDSKGDKFILSFTGGAAGTELTELRINTDKDGDGITIGDPIYDTADGGRGKGGSHDFQIVRLVTSDGRTATATATVEDGGQELVLRMTNFRAGDRLEFSLDVDEVLRNAVDLAVFNDRLDVITSGQEFQDSILNATFDAPHYETATADALFVNDFGDPASRFDLNLPPDEGPGSDSRPNRSAAAVGSAVQTPKPIDIAGTVWIDDNLDLIRQATEDVLPDVELALFQLDTSGNYVDTGHRATTGANGEYRFGKTLGLLPGTYRVVETQPEGLYSVGAVTGEIVGNGSVLQTGVVESSDAIAGIRIDAGDTSAINFDFAEARPVSLAGYVYADIDQDGQRDASETGISGVLMRLVPINTIAPQLTATVATAADGSYSFTGLPPGTYMVVEVRQPDGYTDGDDTAGTVRGETRGRAVNPGDEIIGIRLDGNDDGIEYNFGEWPLGSLAGFVYLATPGETCDGPLHSGETPLSGVAITLIDDVGTIVAETVTGANGGYRFDGVPTGNYTIVETTLSGLIEGGSFPGRIGNVTVGLSDGPSSISSIVLPPAGDAVQYNFCEAAPATVSGHVYADTSNDGIRDDGETGIGDVTVTLVDVDGNLPDRTTITDDNGRYEFDDVTPGNYRIIETQPDDFYDGIDTVGTIDGSVSGSIERNDEINVPLRQGVDGVEYNFGELPPASISGRVHLDLDGDCTLDPGEELLSGVTIRLLGRDDIIIASTTTDALGWYRFENLAPGTYTVVESIVPGTFDGSATVGSAGGIKESANRVGEITLLPGQVAVSYDFCERPPAEISGLVFADRNGDCLFDDGETVLSGVVVELYDDAGIRIASTVTDADGTYRFTDLPAGNYTIREIQPSGYLQGGQRAGSGGGDDSIDDVISSIALGFGDRFVNYNFCELEPAAISGVVYIDANGDCIRDDDELPLGGVIITLRDVSGTVVATTTTDDNGRYEFVGLRPGEYSITETQPEGYFQGGQVPGTGDGWTIADDVLGVNLRPGETLVDYDFCEITPASISGIVHVDADGDCLIDPDEQRLAGVVITLRDEDGTIVGTTLTDAQGRYEFTNLPPGEYSITETQPDGYFQGGQMAGTGDGWTIADDVLGVNLRPGETLVDYNFCEIGPASISGIVHVDADGDCLIDPDEQRLAGVVITLRDGDGTIIGTTLTDAQGRYEFTSLPPGEYSITETQPDGYYQGGQMAGTGDGWTIADDVLGVNLRPGETLVDYNFCEIGPSSISGIVHVDTDGDCVIDPDEPRLAGVVMTLRDGDGTVIGTTLTDAQGRYEFTNLPPGEYSITETQPDGYFQGGQVVGTGNGWVIGDDVLGVDLGSGQTLVDYNFCEQLPASISGLVWSDPNTNQIFDAGEQPIAGVLIELLDASENVVSIARTGDDGRYQFTNLRPGVYAIRETQPDGYFTGGQLVGDAGGRASGDDFLVDITLASGSLAQHYDFPEVPPAMISGYVFQDGDAIVLSQAPDPTTLREYRDGIRSEDDLAIAGVTMELRTLLGLPFAASRALPGYYSGATISVVTDANGYYEFAGLRPGVYHVYQSQPEGLIDGLDTAGTTGGYAVNAADTPSDDDGIVIQTLSSSSLTDPRDDAILNVVLVSGAASVGNNFSEIVIEAPPELPPPIAPPPISQIVPPPPDTPRVLAPLQTFDPAIRLVSFANPVDHRPPARYVNEYEVSWHLSVINGGYPNGDDTRSGVRTVSYSDGGEESRQWESRHNRGRWSIFGRDGQLRQHSGNLLLGDDEATAMTGDFDGDGVDEAVIFVGGDWFVDFDGDGVWDDGDLWIRLGNETDRPVVGDWDGDGKDDIGIFGRKWDRDSARIKRDPGLPDPANRRRREMASDPNSPQVRGAEHQNERWLRRGNDGSLHADAVDHVFQYGGSADVPVAGDWNGDGVDQIGTFRNGQWTLDSDGDGRFSPSDLRVTFGQPGDEPVISDLDGDGIDEIGVVRGDLWIIDTDGDGRITGNDKQIRLPRAAGNDSQPIVGDFDGDGKDDLGYYHRAG